MKTKMQYQLSLGRLTGLCVIILFGAFASGGKAQTVVWQDNFESPTVWDNWSVDNGVWEIGAPLTGPATNSAGYSTHEGTNCAATALDGNYPANTSSRLIRTLPFLVPVASQNPRLQFWHWYQFSGSSYGVVQIKYGSNPWTDLSPRYYATGSGVWTRPVVDLSAYGGKAVQIAFQIVADGNVADGWDVDEVRVVKGDYVVGFTNNAVESFELGLGDWYTETGTWEVGVPTYGPPTNAVGQRAHGGTNCVATVLGGNYEDDRSSRFISPPFVVPSADQSPRLRFWHWWSFANADWGQVQIKVGTNGWQAVSGSYSADSSGRWSRAWLDLATYAGQTVQLAFYFESHNDGWPWFGISVSAGWYVDEVTVETGAPPPMPPVEEFEAGWGGWQADYFGGRATDYAIWEIGQPTYGPPTNALGLRAYAGTNCAATVLDGDYPDDRTSRLVSPAFVVLPAGQNPRLRFWHWWSFSSGDLGRVEIKAGTNAWQALSGNYTADSSGIWTRPVFDLSAYAGQTVQVGFYFESHSGGVSSGWYVDEVSIETGSPPSWTVGSVEGFETPAAKDAWAADYSIWQVGLPTYGPSTNALGRRAYAGTNCLATVLDGNYTDDRSSRIASPAFVMPSSGQHPHLRFWHWWSFANADWGQVQISTDDGLSWNPLSSTYTGTGGTPWTRPDFDLSAYAGQLVRIGFYFESHNDGWPWYGISVSAGWYIDEIVITSVTPPTGIVEFTDVRYFVNEGETNAIITIERKYGSSGAVDVTFVATDGTAVGGVDFDSVVDTISWANGEQGVKTDVVPIHQNCSVRGNKTVTLQLAVPGSVASSMAREEATLVIIDNCLPPLSTTTNIAYLRSLVGTANWVPTNTTSLFTVDGTVTTYTNLSLDPAYELFFMQDGTSGIAVLFSGGTNQFMPQAGDRLRVTASLTSIDGLLLLAPNYASITNVVWRLSASNALPIPAALNFADKTNVTTMEATEARYVVATNVWISQLGGSNFPTVLTRLLVTNQAGATFDLVIDPNTDIAGKVKPAGPVTILGVLHQDDPTAPYTTNYALLPSRYADIVTAPTITGQPQSRTNGVGTTATFTVTAVGTDPLSYQWRRAGTNLLNGGNVSGATSSLLTLANVQLADATNYSVVVTNYLGSATSSEATLTVVVPVSITTQPVSQTNDAGTDVTFSVDVAGTSPFTYQWYFNTSTPLLNATNAVLILPAVQTNQAGTYHVVVNNAANLPTNSSKAVLAVNVVPVGFFIPDGNGFGSFTKTNNVYNVTGGGEDIEGTEDRFFFVYLPWTGDGEIMANLKNLVPAPSANRLSEAGVMFRDGMGGGARHVFLAMNAQNHTIFRRRLAENDSSVQNGYHGTNDVWLKLMRMGDTFIGHYSTNGVNWELVWWTTQTNMPANLNVGLAVTAHNNGEFATAEFEMVGPRNLTPLSGTWPLPGPQIQMGGEPGGMAEFQRVGGFKFLVGGVVGDQFSVNCSANAAAPLASWASLGAVTNTYGVVPFIDPQALTNPTRFYRAQKVGP